MASMAAYLFIFAHFGNIVCTNSNRQVNITHVVSKETFELDKALNLTEQAENGTLGPDLTVPTERYSSATEPAEAPVLTTNEIKTTDRSTFTPSNSEITRQRASSVPLPLSGSLPQPVRDVSAVCPCNLQRAQCDVNCCCDPDCSQELALFTQCSVQKVSGDVKLCSQDAAVHTLTITPDGLSRVSTSVQRETNPDVLCIHSANYGEGMSFITPEIPSEQNFDSLFDRFVGFSFGLWRGSASQRPAQGNSPGYTYGDLIHTISPAGQRDFLRLPTSAGSSHCLDTNPAAFLKDQSSSCVRNVVLAEDCTTLEALNLRSYTRTQIFSGKDKDAVSVPVTVESVTLQSLEGTHTQVVTDSAASAYQPEFLPGAEVCNRAVLQVKYTVSFGDAGQIVRVLASFLLGAIDKTRVPLQQQFLITFVQESKSDATLRSSGNPGYVVGLPLVAGWKTAEGVIQSSAPDGSLTVLKSSADQDCLSGSTQRSPVLFGVDTVSGCTFRLEDGANCSLISEAVLGSLKGQNFPDCVASFGNSFPQKPMDWIPIENRTTPMVTQGCSVPVSYHLEVRWTKFGTLVNPQAQIVSVMEVIGFNTSTLPSPSTGTGVVSVLTSVGFVDVSAPASPGYRAPPTITAKLPFDFFFPFV